MNLLEKLTAKAEKAAIDKAFAKGLMRCPTCGAKPLSAPTDVNAIIRCGACGAEALPAEWKPEPAGVATVHPDQIPADTRIRRETTAIGESIWHIPASGKFGFFLFFGLFWTAITAVVSFAFLFGSQDEVEGSAPWFMYPFLSIFWVIGLGMLYAALRNKYARHQIIVTRDLVTMRREMFGRVKEKSLVTSQVNSVAQVEFYQQNYQPVYGVEIRGRGGKLRFGTTLAEEEKAWLVADISRGVFGESRMAGLASRTPEVIAAQRQSSFSFPLPQGPKNLWITGVLFVLIGLGVICFAAFKGRDFPGAGRGEEGNWQEFAGAALFSAHVIVPVIFGLIFCVAGLVGLGMVWSKRNREMRLEGDETQVALRTYQHGRVIKEQSFARSSVGGVRATSMGHVNGKPMKRIDLIVDGRAQSVVRWADGDAADVWVSDVGRALGK